MNRALFYAATLVAGMACGCAGWKTERFDVSQLRDERAADLDRRLSGRPSAVANPFGTTSGDEAR